ncbi:MAG: YceI family protein [Hyphomonadaceae bacterium]|nr:YceI family protein [Hyphomonadaceae bacterium]
MVKDAIRSANIATTVTLCLALASWPLIGPAEAEISPSTVQGATPSGVYQVDANHRYLTFSYDHLGYSHPILRFDDFTASLTLDAVRPENSRVDATIQTASLRSGVVAFDGHLASARFFDAAQFPTITFRSTKVTPTSPEGATVVGDLTIKGVTHPATLNVTLNRAGSHPMSGRPTVGFTATGKITRSQWGLGAMSPAVGDQIDIHIEAEFSLAP